MKIFNKNIFKSKFIFKKFLANYSKFYTKMNVIPIEALSDNYMYLVVDETTKECAVIDPVEPNKILDQVNKLNLKLTKILTTHHHWDHADGNPALVKSLSDPIPVYGGDDRIPALTNKVTQNDTIKIGSNLNVTCLFTPCHTTGHICYYITLSESSIAPIVFTGDTLFLSGCGRFFEGDAQQMFDALLNKLAKLPENTNVYCGHEYSVSNLKYALHVEPDNEAAKQKLNWAIKQRESNLRTIPSTIKEELNYNPFMRVNLGKIQARYNTLDAISCMRAMRNEKDTWKPNP